MIPNRTASSPVTACLSRGLAVFASIVVSGAASAQSSSPAPDAARPAPPAAQATAASPWDAPEPWRTDRFYLETSVYTRHFHYDPAHDDRQNLILGEWNITEQWLAGASVFDNSFGQSSQYVYGGYRFRPFERLQPLYFKVSAGLVHGYRGSVPGQDPPQPFGDRSRDRAVGGLLHQPLLLRARRLRRGGRWSLSA